MDVQFYPKNCELVISFEPTEAPDSAFLLQLVWEEEWQRGTTVPDFRNGDFFQKLASSKRKACVKFDYLYLEFIIVFLEETCIELADKGIDTTMLEQFLSSVYDYCPAGHIIQ